MIVTSNPSPSRLFFWSLLGERNNVLDEQPRHAAVSEGVVCFDNRYGLLMASLTERLPAILLMILAPFTPELGISLHGAGRVRSGQHADHFPVSVQHVVGKETLLEHLDLELAVLGDNFTSSHPFNHFQDN